MPPRFRASPYNTTLFDLFEDKIIIVAKTLVVNQRHLNDIIRKSKNVIMISDNGLMVAFIVDQHNEQSLVNQFDKHAILFQRGRFISNNTLIPMLPESYRFVHNSYRSSFEFLSKESHKFEDFFIELFNKKFIIVASAGQSKKDKLLSIMKQDTSLRLGTREEHVIYSRDTGFLMVAFIVDERRAHEFKNKLIDTNPNRNPNRNPNTTRQYGQFVSDYQLMQIGLSRSGNLPLKLRDLLLNVKYSP